MITKNQTNFLEPKENIITLGLKQIPLGLKKLRMPGIKVMQFHLCKLSI